MRLIYLFCTLLILGIFLSQFIDLEEYRSYLLLFADISLGYIMMEVGLEFVLEKENWKEYLKDYFVAFMAATLPWLFCFFYLLYIVGSNTWEETLLIARFAAPTSSGILFAMLAAAGLAMTWLFRKVEILAIFDDIDTILLLIPLQFLLGGTRYALLSIIGVIVLLLFLAWRYLHRVKIPSGRLWLFLYSILLASVIRWINQKYEIEFEILLPAFVLGMMLYNPHNPRFIKKHVHEHAFIEPEEPILMYFDRGVKTFFMFTVGLLLPKIAFGELNLWLTGLHVLLITVLSNLGKCFPIFCYKDEASLRERTAVSVGLFPRGEVGAGILVLAIEHQAAGYATTIAGLSLALNLMLTGIFMTVVVKLVRWKSA